MKKRNPKYIRRGTELTVRLNYTTRQTTPGRSFYNLTDVYTGQGNIAGKRFKVFKKGVHGGYVHGAVMEEPYTEHRHVPLNIFYEVYLYQLDQLFVDGKISLREYDLLIEEAKP